MRGKVLILIVAAFFVLTNCSGSHSRKPITSGDYLQTKEVQPIQLFWKGEKVPPHTKIILISSNGNISDGYGVDGAQLEAMRKAQQYGGNAVTNFECWERSNNVFTNYECRGDVVRLK